METVAEVFDRIMAAKQWNKRQLAKHMGIDSSILSQKLGAEWNHHWRVFVKLLPIMLELKILKQEQLYSASDNDTANGDGQTEAKSVKSQDNLDEKGPPINPFMETLVPHSLLLQ